jgi:hypothetical protein
MNILNILHNLLFFSSKCCLFHNEAMSFQYAWECCHSICVGECGKALAAMWISIFIKARCGEKSLKYPQNIGQHRQTLF